MTGNDVYFITENFHDMQERRKLNIEYAGYILEKIKSKTCHLRLFYKIKGKNVIINGNKGCKKYLLEDFNYAVNKGYLVPASIDVQAKLLLLSNSFNNRKAWVQIHGHLTEHTTI